MRFTKLAALVTTMAAISLIGASPCFAASVAETRVLSPDNVRLKVTAFPVEDVKPACSFEIPLQQVPLGDLTFVMPAIVNWGIYQGSGDSYLLSLESADIGGERYGAITMFAVHYQDFGLKAQKAAGALDEFVSGRIAAAESQGFEHVETQFSVDASGNINVARATFTHPEGLDMLALIAIHSKTNEMGFMLVFLNSELCEKGALDAFTVKQTVTR